MLDDGYQPLAQLTRPGFARGVLAGVDAGLAVAARDRPQSIAGWRPILGMSVAPEADSTVVMSKTPEVRPAGRHVSTLPPPAAPGTGRTGLWIAIAVVLLALLGGGGYYAIASRGPDPEMTKARAAAEEAEAKRLKAEEEAAKLRTESEQRQKAEQAAAAAKQPQETEAAAQKQLRDATRRQDRTAI